MIRVVHLVERLDRGGLERVVETLALHSDRDRFDIRVWTLCGGGGIARSLERSAVRVEPVECGSPAMRPRYVRRLAERLRRDRIDVVHGHGWLPGALARISGLLAGVPGRISHRHTTDQGEGLRHAFFERLLSRTGWTVCCSEAVRARAVLRSGCDPLRTEVVHNGVDVERFSIPHAGSRTPGEIVTVAGLRRLKGHHVLLEAAALLRSSGAELKLVFVGDGDQRQALQELARSLGVAPLVRFVGERPDVVPHLHSASIFALPSTGREGLPLGVLEAMACGLPVVASDAGGTGEIVRQGLTGFLADPGDPAGLADALGILLGDPGRAQAIGLAGRNRVEERFSARAMTAKIEEIHLRSLERTDRRKTVLFLSARGRRFGGGQEGLRLLATGIDPGRFRPVVASPEPGGLNAELSSSGIRTLLIPMPSWRSWRIDRALAAGMRLRRLCRMISPGLVHVDSTRTALYALCLPRRIRRIWHLRDSRPDRWDRLLASRFDRLVAVSTAAAARFADGGSDLVEVVDNAVTVPASSCDRKTARLRLSIPSSATVLLCVGRVEPDKGMEELVRAVDRLSDERREEPLLALIAGENVGNERERLERLAGELGVGGRIRFLGRRDDIGDLMQASDLLVHPSHHEAAPRVVIEAMASGLPVVATETGGTAEILEGCGRLVPVGDSMSLACEIADLASDPEARRELSEAAHLRFRERFLPDNHLERIHLLYDRLTGESREWSRAS